MPRERLAAALKLVQLIPRLCTAWTRVSADIVVVCTTEPANRRSKKRTLSLLLLERTSVIAMKTQRGYAHEQIL